MKTSDFSELDQVVIDAFNNVDSFKSMSHNDALIVSDMLNEHLKLKQRQVINKTLLEHSVLNAIWFVVLIVLNQLSLFTVNMMVITMFLYVLLMSFIYAIKYDNAKQKCHVQRDKLIVKIKS